MAPRTPTLADLLLIVCEAVAVGLHVSLPGRVERYDAAAGLADVKPLLKDRIVGEDDAVASASLPVVTDVPVVFPGAGGFCLTFPVQVGDTVLLVFTDRAIEKWIGHGGEVDPVDPRRHALSDAIAIPGLRSAAWANAAAATDHATLGADGGTRLHLKADHVELGEGAADAAALASLVLARLTAIVDAFNSHVHTSGGSGSPTTTPTVPMGTPSAVASSLLKLQG